ncbi:hypothetical protein [Mesorhizobium escarrei]|uniref:Uncharacterized protein n=1 Tax=Mesorhizobium escarrei TaxID=666018 RepID=A0ABM9EF85_9HYPH|nr:hypothetical protein [Mesorhizobium escarrei]CAH2407914.1 conserved hypothetical protein [Mesorhizobium escarrei]
MTDERKRQAPISYRPPEELREEFRARVEKSGLSVNAFITASIFGAPAPRQARRPAVEHREVARLLAETARLHDRLQAMAGGHDPALLDEAVRDLREIRAACLVALGRSP